MRSIVIYFVAFGLSLVSALSYHGADFSSLPLLESTTGVQYTASSTAAVQPFESVLSSYGANIARIRIWTTGTYDMTYGLQLAKRAKAAGMSLLIDLHYDDTWADSGHQAIPSGWPTDLQGLLTQIYNYTYALMQAFNNQGTPIDFIQIGNEINDGLLWPIGRISVNGFDGASELLHSGASAVRAASPSTKTVIHLANGWNQADISYFYNGIFIPGKLSTSDVDVMGFSFYPFYGTTATLSNLDSSMNYVVSTYNKGLMIVETNWPAVCDTTATQLSEPSIPVGTQGQITWAEDIAAVLNKYGSNGLGILYWEPGWIGNGALGSGCADNLLVTSNGVARQSMTLFSDV